MTEDKMVRWYHRLNEHEFGQAPGDGEGQGSLACFSPWGHKEPDTTEQLSNNKGPPAAAKQGMSPCSLQVPAARPSHKSRGSQPPAPCAAQGCDHPEKSLQGQGERGMAALGSTEALREDCGHGV